MLRFTSLGGDFFGQGFTCCLLVPTSPPTLERVRQQVKPFSLAIMSKWSSYSLYPGSGKMPNTPCVYAVYFDGGLVYIGQTNGLSNRFSGRIFRYSYFRTIITPWMEVPDTTKITIKARTSDRFGDWAMREIRLIRRLQPLFNIHHKKPRKVQP